ncbi:MAG: hypothetical protein ABR548_11540 [Actinomycetota bacterium]
MTLAVGLALGWFSSALLFDDGVGRYSGRDRVAAEDAVETAARGCSNRIGWRLIVPNLSLRKIRVEPTDFDGVPAYSAELREQTLFGIAIGNVVLVRGSDTGKGRLDCDF